MTDAPPVPTPQQSAAGHNRRGLWLYVGGSGRERTEGEYFPVEDQANAKHGLRQGECLWATDNDERFPKLATMFSVPFPVMFVVFMEGKGTQNDDGSWEVRFD